MKEEDKFNLSKVSSDLKDLEKKILNDMEPEERKELEEEWKNKDVSLSNTVDKSEEDFKKKWDEKLGELSTVSELKEGINDMIKEVKDNFEEGISSSLENCLDDKPEMDDYFEEKEEEIEEVLF